MVVGEDADDVRAALDLLVDALEQIRAGDLRPVLPRDVYAGEDFVARAVHQGCEFGLLLPRSVGDHASLGDGLSLGLPEVDRLQRRRHDPALPGGRKGKGIAHSVSPAPLVRGVEDAARGRAQALA